mgnify:CR=1 FL=1
MPPHKAMALLDDLRRALSRFQDVLKQPQNEFIRDAAIQRFEFCFELTWKTIQSIAVLEGQDCPSPRMAFSTAWRNGWISDEGIFLDMLEERNRTSHTYKESTAIAVFENLPEYVPALTNLLHALEKRLDEIIAQENQTS